MRSYQSFDPSFDEEQAPLAGPKVAPKAQRPGFASFAVAAIVIVFTVVLYGTNLRYSASSSLNLSASINIDDLDASFAYSEMSPDDQANAFEQFISKFSKSYKDSDAKDAAFEHFKNFLERVDERNEEERVFGRGLAEHGITQFADISQEEFESLLGYIAATHEEVADVEEWTEDGRKLEDSLDSLTVATTGTVDWADIYTTPIKNQGYCGSCWAFSATSQIESDAIREGLLSKTEHLAPEQITQCTEASFGCDGGNTNFAYRYVNTNGGIALETSYPYTSEDGETGDCSTTSSTKYAVTVDTFYQIKGEVSMAHYVMSTGTLSVCVDAAKWSSYKSGVVSTCGDSIDHCVQITGVNTEESYWIVRNQWSENWGDDGFIYINKGNDTCGISSFATFTSVSKVWKEKKI